MTKTQVFPFLVFMHSKRGFGVVTDLAEGNVDRSLLLVARPLSGRQLVLFVVLLARKFGGFGRRTPNSRARSSLVVLEMRGNENNLGRYQIQRHHG